MSLKVLGSNQTKRMYQKNCINSHFLMKLKSISVTVFHFFKKKINCKMKRNFISFETLSHLFISQFIWWMLIRRKEKVGWVLLTTFPFAAKEKTSLAWGIPLSPLQIKWDSFTSFCPCIKWVSLKHRIMILLFELRQILNKLINYHGWKPCIANLQSSTRPKETKLLTPSGHHVVSFGKVQREGGQ